MLTPGMAFAEFYSYIGPDGKMMITDKPVNRKGYKLKRAYKPPTVVEEERKRAAKRRRQRGRAKRPDRKYILTAVQLDALVDPIATTYKVDPELVKAIISVESSGNARSKSNKGAMGLMQLIPETAERFGIKNPWDPRQNIKGGVRYLRFLLAFFEGDVNLVLAGYNAGENAVDRYGGVPPYRETRNYIKKVRKLYKTETLAFDQNVRYRAKLTKHK